MSFYFLCFFVSKIKSDKNLKQQFILIQTIFEEAQVMAHIFCHSFVCLSRFSFLPMILPLGFSFKGSATSNCHKCYFIFHSKSYLCCIIHIQTHTDHISYRVLMFIFRRIFFMQSDRSKRDRENTLMIERRKMAR